jgi:hypothetical protein
MNAGYIKLNRAHSDLMDANREFPKVIVSIGALNNQGVDIYMVQNEYIRILMTGPPPTLAQYKYYKLAIIVIESHRHAPVHD